MSPWLVFAEHRRNALQRRLQPIRTQDGGWTTIYSDPETGEEWLATYLHPEYHGGGWPYLMRLPAPGIEDLIELAVGSRLQDEAELAAKLLATEPDAREALLRRLQMEAAGADTPVWERIGAVLRWANLQDGTNRRPTVGKYVSEIRQDYAHSESLAREASELLARAEVALSRSIG